VQSFTGAHLSTMRPPVFRLLAAAAVSILALSRANALSVSHTTVQSVSDNVSGRQNVVAFGNWFHPAFDPNLGTLQRVTFEVAVAANATAHDRNYYFPDLQNPIAVSMTPYVDLRLSAGLYDGASMFGHLTVTESGPTTVVQPFGPSELSTAIAALLQFSTTDGADLARFAGVGQTLPMTVPHFAYYHATFSGSSTWGYLAVNGNVTTTLTYHYNVNDGGGTAWMFAPLLLYVFGVHRRQQALRAMA
jgi:hypothetical protein